MKIEKLETFSLVTLLLGLSNGSAFYLIHPLIKPTFILPIVAVFTLLFSKSYFINKLNSLILIFIFLALFFNFLYPTENNIIDIYYIALLYPVYITANIAARKYRKSDETIALVITTVIALVCGIYIYEINTGVMLIEKKSIEEGLYSSTFNNPNDLAAFIASFSILLLLLLDNKYKSTIVTLIAYIIIFIFTFLLGSRASLLIIVIVPILYLFFTKKKMVTPIIIVAAIVLISTIELESKLQALSYSETDVVARTASKISLAMYSYDDDKSINYRLDSYFYFLKNLHQTILGVGTKNYEHFYGNDFLGTVVNKNPHSFFIEITIAFGWLGLSILIAIMVLILKNYLIELQNKERFAALFTLVIFVAVSFVPSTIIRLPILFFPIFFFYCLSIEK